jgi:23S rRNA (uracil1939-C5)-methyltransferase
VGGALFLVSPRAFFQANRFLLEPFLEEVRQPIRRLAAEHGSTWGLDLYAGAGFLTRALAEALPRTVAVEPDAVSLSDLRANAAAWEPELKSRITVHAGTAESYLAKFKGRGGTVIVDPPRAGVSPEVRRALLHLRPDLLVYVSCDPATLARDLRDLKKSFRIRSLAILNLFPATHHMETVAVLEPAALSERLPQPRSAD